MYTLLFPIFTGGNSYHSYHSKITSQSRKSDHSVQTPGRVDFLFLRQSADVHKLHRHAVQAQIEHLAFDHRSVLAEYEGRRYRTISLGVVADHIEIRVVVRDVVVVDEDGLQSGTLGLDAFVWWWRWLALGRVLKRNSLKFQTSKLFIGPIKESK